jgi:hypothetical protein
VELPMRRLDESTMAAVTEAMAAAAGEKLSVASTTVRAVEIIERHAKAGEWVQVDARRLLGTEQEVESVDPDEFCAPELPQADDLKEFIKLVGKLADGAKLQSPGAKERYKEIMKRHFRAYCLPLPGKLDVPKLRLIARPGPPIRDARGSMNPEDEEWFEDASV